MEGDPAITSSERSEPEYAPVSDVTDSVEVEGHICDDLRSQHGFSKSWRTVSMATLQHYTAHCSACCLLSHATDANLPDTHREDARITVRYRYQYAEFYVSGVSAEDGSVVQSDRFLFFTPSGMSLSLKVAKKTMAEKEEIDWSFDMDLPFHILWNVDLIPRDTSSNASLVWAERQIAKCNQDHNCLSSAQGSPLPSRVLDVSLRDAERSIRLLTTTNQRERYVCLSHCWGDGASVTKTTR
jgi:hypothetical protein